MRASGTISSKLALPDHLAPIDAASRARLSRSRSCFTPRDVIVCSMLTSRRAGIVHSLDIKPTDAVVELIRQALESSVRHSKQRVDLVRNQVNSKLETGAGRVPKEVSPEPRVGQQAAERPFYVTLTHAPVPDSPLARIAPGPLLHSITASARPNGTLGAAVHVNV